MKCGDARRRMSAYFDSELDGDITFEITEHLGECRACRERFDAERGADDAMADRLRGETMPPGLRTALRARIFVAAPGFAPARSGSARLRRSIRWSLAAAALVAALALAHFRQGARGPEIEPVLAFLAMTSGAQRAAWVAAELGEGAEPVLVGDLRLRTGRPSKHALRFVALEAEDGTVRPYVDVRLLCCGEPVLMRIYRLEALDALGDLAARVAEEGQLTVRRSGLSLSAHRVGDYVAVAVSRHRLGPELRSAIHS